MIQEKITFQNQKDQTISGRIYSNESTGSNGVIFSHGLFSTKDGYKITQLAEDIVRAGFSLLTFDFSFTGESEGDIADISILQEAKDLECAVDYFLSTGIEKVHLMGSSMGAAVSLLYCSEGKGPVLSLTCIATPIDIKALLIDNADISDPASLPENGKTDLQGIMIKNSFFKEVMSINMISAVKKIDIPILAIHGGEDIIVKPDNVLLLENNSNDLFQKVIIDDGDHNLTRDSDLVVICDSAIEWFHKWDK